MKLSPVRLVVERLNYNHKYATKRSQEFSKNGVHLTYTRTVHKLVRQCKLKGLWKRCKLNLHDWTYQLYFSLHVKFQSYSYTRLIAESIRRTSPGGVWSTPPSQTLRQQVTMTLMQLGQRHSISMYTPLMESTSNDTEPTYPIHMFN